MKAHRFFPVGALLALLGFPIQIGAQETGFFSAVKVRGGVQIAAKEDNLSSVMMGFGLEGGYAFRFGRLSGEAGFSYKPGNQYLHDLSKMPIDGNWIIDDVWAVDSRKNQLDGLFFRAAYEKPFQNIGLRIGVQIGGSNFRQEYIADIWGWRSSEDKVTDEEGKPHKAGNRGFEDTYNGIHNKNGLSISLFAGISISSENYFWEIQLLGLSYTAADYVHRAGTVPGGYGKGHTLFDDTLKLNRFSPHIEFALGFRF
ncbi:MAG: hypothetical protein LBH03_07155 [Holophagales bacterium]|jgi:hypothetical protein|nr:hypothetical protein [Holophagales bacterium]